MTWQQALDLPLLEDTALPVPQILFRRIEDRGLFTFSDRISVRREVPDGAADDEGIAPAIAEEADAADGSLAADRKLTQKVNKPEDSEIEKEMQELKAMCEKAKAGAR